MRGFTLALVALLVTTSCTTRQRIAGGGVALAVTGIYLGFSTETRDEAEIGAREKIGIGLLLGGLATLFVAAALEESDNESAVKPREIKAKPVGPEPAVEQAQQKRQQAWELTKQAQEAARADDCAKVTALSVEVGTLDRDFYGEVFMTDVAIQRCLTPATPVEPPPAPPPVAP